MDGDARLEVTDAVKHLQVAEAAVDYVRHRRATRSLRLLRNAERCENVTEGVDPEGYPVTPGTRGPHDDCASCRQREQLHTAHRNASCLQAVAYRALANRVKGITACTQT